MVISSFIFRPRRAGSGCASRRLPGMKHGPWALDSCSWARVFRVGSVPVISAGSPGCPGPDEVVREQVPITVRSWWTSATPGFLLQCADFAAPTVFPIRAAVLQNSIHTTRQGMRDGGLGHVRFLAAAQAMIAPRERIAVLHGHVGGGDQAQRSQRDPWRVMGPDACTSPLS